MVETIGCSGMTHSAAMASEILPGLTVLEALIYNEVLELVCAQKSVKRLMVIPNAEDAAIYNKVRDTLRKADDDDKRITVFAMQPQTGGNYRQEILGYSLMAALGIHSEEIQEKMRDER